MNSRLVIKTLMVLVICILLSGCTADYNAIIRSDNTVKESIKITMPNKLILKKGTSVRSVLNNQIDAYMEIEKYKDYDYSKHIGKDYSDVKLIREYKTLNNFSDSPFLQNLFENVTVVQNEEYNIFETVGNYYPEYLFGAESEGSGPPPETAFKDVKVTIKLHNKVLETSADVEDLPNNVYVWNITPGDDAVHIYIKYSNDKRYDVIIKSFIMDNIIQIIVIGTFIFAILTAIFIYRRVYINNNRI